MHSDRSRADDYSLAKLTDYCDRHEIFLPGDGFIQPCMEIGIGRLLESVGEIGAVMQDELGIAEFRVDADRFLEPPSVVLDLPLSVRGTVPANRLVSDCGRLECSTYEGAFYMIIRGLAFSGDDDLLAKQFDGFWCPSDSVNDWWRDRPRRVDC